ncbi:GNAT family N-acetyltransferase [Jeotgalibacillus haloalkalitolerans]|uniref:GNAT family N-acetyltransferase n=1 Tax=Jeotgalibacillus haloalkalitolerans TaxID=3104292 RepID=A0ABU5KI92_9BACL|nr:GNAT family N-acetyltransferase [Jeotgalibacillus sp. HH7-29]MDZ5710943.1 GNAT family N-acetyltransferase [Jeotgalibacillus sp. HH7-29]
MKEIQLVKPEKVKEEAYQAYIREWQSAEEEIIPHASIPKSKKFEEQVENWRREELGLGIPEGWVSGSLFFLINRAEKVLGAVHIRHELTETLFQRGGHIGYGIRPDERKKGYATEILKLSLREARELGINDVLITCDDDNPGSYKTIESNGGVRDPQDAEENGVLVRRYWIR